MFLRLLILTLLLSMTAFSQTPPIETGVPQTLAKWRAANYSDVRYKLNLTLEKMSPTLKGTIEISVKNNADQIVLDWRKIKGQENLSTVSNVSINGTALTLQRKLTQEGAFLYYDDYYEEINEHLVFKDGVRAGENVIKLDFTSPILTSGGAITRYVDKEDNAEYIYSLFVPSDASTAFPVFDQPDLKARFQVSATTPKKWKFITNLTGKVYPSGKVISHNTVGPPNVDWNENYFVFEETKPISTYVFAFAAGDFAEIDCRGDSCGRPMSEAKTDVGDKSTKDSDVRRFGQAQDLPLQNPLDVSMKIYVRKSQAEKFKQHAAETFRLNREAVKYLAQYFDYKFPFPKYDLVLIPEFPFGGMEHAGATFLREDRIIFPTEPTKNDFVTRANLIFHEAAHQWFGDMVTMRWFDDLWLKEGFAEFMAYKTLEKVMPEYNAWKIFYERNKQLAYLTDSTKGTTPIYQEIPNLASAKSAYGNIVYRKAPSFLKQSEFYLGADKFQTGVRAFLKKHEFANAEWTDLVKEFETASGRNLDVWAKNWVTQRTMPKVKIFPYLAKPTNMPSCYGEQQNILKEKGWWEMSFRVLHIKRNGERTIIGCSINKANLDALKPDFVRESPNDVFLKPRKVFDEIVLREDEAFIPNYLDYGYGLFLLDKQSRAYVLKNIQNEKDDFLRTMMWGSLWDSVREAELSPKDYVELVIKNISVETDESTIQTLLNRTATAMNYYLSKEQADVLSLKLETVLIEKMQNAPTLGQRITFYRAFLNIASSENARQNLKEILNLKSQISNFKLKTKDKFDIVTKLLILGDKDAPQLLAELEKSETSDEAKRYAYAARAGIATAEDKAKFWNDFTGNKEISESWIESAVTPFNSVRHSELTLPFLEKALAELPNLKRSRKIFFVNGWLGAFIGGQRDEKALAIVNKFLADNPNIDKDLRLKILENVDGLERAVKIRAKFSS
jgi:aminopeptidase N